MSEIIVNQLKEVFNKLNKKLKESESNVYKLIKDGETLKSDLENLYNIIKVFIEENREKFKKQEEKSKKELEIKLNALELSLNNLLISIHEEIEKIKNDSNEKIKDILKDIENIKKLIDKLKFQISNIRVLGIAPPTNVKADYVSSGEFGKNSTPGEYIFSSPLTISNQLKITSGNPGSGKVLTSDDQGNVSWQIPPIIGSISVGQIAFGTSPNTIGGDNNLFWDNTNKRLGIGTQTPNSALHVIGDIRHSGNLISQGTNYAFTWMSFDEDQGGNSLFLGSGGLTVIGGGESASQVRGNIPTSDERLVLASDKTGTSIAHHFITNLQNGWTNKIDAMVILGNGNVGIGTTSPTHKLTISGSDVSFRIYNTNSGVTYDGLFFRGPIWQSGNEKSGFISCQNNKGLDILTFTTSGASNNGRIRIGSANSGIRFYFSNQNVGNPDDSSYWNEVFTILPSGYVGIGATSPNSPLHIEKSINIAGDNTHLRVKQGPNGLYGAKISIDATALSGGSVWELFSSAGTAAEGQGKFIIIDRNQSSARLTIDTSGNVGIGTTSPTAKLDINSDTIRLRNSKTPPTSGSSGNKGDIAWDSDYLYVCVDTNTWKRIPLQTW
ncbi:MAG: hypothetical protein NC926_06470 [Candidatus Omnitrophica bacterium]|nr:hypothetical protein [Candidatus Omnitrophota bacterium]